MDKKILNRGYGALEKEFKDPGREFRGKPFWSWNGELEENELKRQVDVLKEMGFGGYFMHSRAGLITEYLGEEWFDLCNKVAEHGRETGMESWLYDEDRWPSGCAGGIVTKDPQYRMKSLALLEAFPEDGRQPGLMRAIFEALIAEDGITLLKYRPFDGKLKFKPREGEKHRLLKFCVVYDKPSSGCNGTTYIDTMMKAATEKFIEITHEQYKKHAGPALWKEIKGIFTDEPHRGHLLDDARRDENGLLTCSICWTDDFFEEFEKRYGYDAKALLPELFYKAPDFDTSLSVKHDWVDLANNLFIERFADPINDWCVKNGIDFTGHVLHEDSLTNQTVPNGSLMRFYGHMGVPGIDNLTEYANVFWAAKQIQSAARQLDKKWLLSELYGCTGWQFNFRSHKIVGDWQALYGINVRCPHLSWYTMEGEAKRDYPGSILHQSPYYKDYSYVEDYFARFGVLMTEGKDVCDVLVINPIESVWTGIYSGWAHWIIPADGPTNKLEENYRNLFYALRAANIDFDYGDEQMMAEMASVEEGARGASIKFGAAEYKTVIVSGLTTIRGTTLKLLKDFAEKGGRVVVLGDGPDMVDAKKSSEFEKIAAAKGSLTAENVIKHVKAFEPVRVDIGGAENCEIHFRIADARETDGILTLGLVNTDRVKGAENVKVRLKGIPGITACAEWCLEDGKKYRVRDFEASGDTASLETDFFPAGERFFVFYIGENSPVFDEEDVSGRRVSLVKTGEFELKGEFEYALGEKNAAVLDFADASMETLDGRKKDFETKEILKLDREIRDFVGIEHRGGGMLQPWYAKKYANDEYGRLTVRFEFDAETVPESDVMICGERPEFIDYYLNGRKLEPDGGFWVDSCLKTMPAKRDWLKKGKNEVRMVTDFRRTTNLESVYIVGDFGVKSELLEKNPAAHTGDKGNIYSRFKTLTTLPGKLTFDNITDQNLLTYTGTVTYKITPEHLKGITLKEGERAVIKADGYTGSLIKVAGPCGEDPKVLGWEPYTADVTAWIKTGFTVTLVCSRKNLFGPLHVIPAIPGAVGPETFLTGGANFTEDLALMDSKVGKVMIEKVKV